MQPPTSAQPPVLGRLLVATTIPASAAAFLAHQLPYLADRGWDVDLVTSDGPEIGRLAELPGVRVHLLPMHREISPSSDLVSLRRWLGLVRQIRPDAVMVGTPKAGLLGTVAARAARVPVRVYVVRGLRFEGLQGWRRWASLAAERTSCRCATDVVAVSPSVREELVRRRLARPDRVVVLGRGTTEGVDVERFSPAGADARAAARRALGIEDGTTVVGFVGRLAADKGLPELVDAVDELRRRGRDVTLLVVGGLDESAPLAAAERARLEAAYVVRTGTVPDVAPLYAAMDVLCLPSHREGFPNVAVEGAACGLPFVTTDATGCRDAVEPGVTGLMVRVGDVPGLAAALDELVVDPALRTRLGSAARDLAVSSFDRRVLDAQVDDLLRRRIGVARVARAESRS